MCIIVTYSIGLLLLLLLLSRITSWTKYLFIWWFIHLCRSHRRRRHNTDAPGRVFGVPGSTYIPRRQREVVPLGYQHPHPLCRGICRVGVVHVRMWVGYDSTNARIVIDEVFAELYWRASLYRLCMYSFICLCMCIIGSLWPKILLQVLLLLT